jgi:hypothetical protein
MNKDRNVEGCIENFLGNEIVTNPIVTNLRLNADEQLKLEGPLTLEELDLALEGANLSSSAGLDGITTKFIKRFWGSVFRLPLHRYAATVFEKGKLTDSFRSAIVKLIPKKGLASNISKWRPISLLSCMYKILSRAINNRLKTVINRFTSRALKGFTNHRYIQEVLINVCETISYCNENRIGGALL